MAHAGRLPATERHPWSFAAAMERPDIGVDVGDFRLAPKDALRLAVDLSFREIELPATSHLETSLPVVAVILHDWWTGSVCTWPRFAATWPASA